MADGHSQIESHEHSGAHDQHQQKELQKIDDGIGMLGQAAKDGLPQLSVKQFLPVQRHHQEHCGKTHDAVDHGGGKGTDQLGQDKLPGLDGEGVHQIALVPQQTLIKPGEYEHGGQDDHGEAHAAEQTHGDHAHPLAKGTASGVVHSKHGEPVEECQDQRRRPDHGELLPHGAEVIF